MCLSIHQSYEVIMYVAKYEMCNYFIIFVKCRSDWFHSQSIEYFHSMT